MFFFLPWKSWFKQWKWNKQFTEVIQSSFLHGTKFLQMIGVIWVVFIGNLDYTIQHFIIVLYIVLLIWLQRKKKTKIEDSDDLNSVKYIVIFVPFWTAQDALRKSSAWFNDDITIIVSKFQQKNKILIYMAM